MSDDEDTDKRRPRGMSDADRALLGSESRRRSRTPIVVPTTDPIPIIDQDEITSPMALMERPIHDSERAIANRLRRESSDPLTAFADAIAKLTHRLDRVQRDTDSGNRDRGRQLDEMLETPRQIRSDVALLKTDMSELKTANVIRAKREAFWAKLGWIIAASAVAGIIAIGVMIKQSGASDERVLMRLDYLETEMHELRMSSQPSRWPMPTIGPAITPLPATKAQP